MKRLLLAACALLLLAACNPENPKADKPASPAAAHQTATFAEFSTTFPEGKLPMLFPREGQRVAESFDGGAVQTYFGDSLLAPFPGEERAPAPGECCKGIGYAAVARFTQKDKWTALVLYKEYLGGEPRDTASGYYYLATFDPAGKQISSLCIAAKEKDLERSAALNEDLSLELRQTENGKEEAALSRFFEITPEGKIQAIGIN